jgi:hypothetical protein
MFPESYSDVSLLLRRGVSAGTGISMKIRLRPSIFLTDLGPLRLILNGRNIPFVDHLKHLGLIFDKMIKWRLHVEMTETKAFRTFIRIYSLFKSERLNDQISNVLCLPRLGINSRNLHSFIHSFIHPSMALQPFVGPWPLLQFRNLFLYRE